MSETQVPPRARTNEPDPAPGPVSRPFVAPLRYAAPALLGYVAVRLTGLAILLVTASAQGKDGLLRLYGRWDSLWYQRIAEHGYGLTVTLPDGTVHSDLAFFPLLPALERALHALVPPLDLAGAGLAVSWVASVAAAWGIFAVGARLYGRRAGVLLAVLWGAYPTAFVQSMAYTETLFTALAAWSLYAVLRDRWVSAGLLAVGAGLTRPVAAALIAAIGIAGLWRLFVTRDAGVRPGRVVAGVLLAPLGWLSYVVFVAVREGDPLAYFEVQAGWDNRVDGGVALARFVGEQFGANVLAGLGLCAAFAVLGWALWAALRLRPALPVAVYGVAVVVISLIGSGYFGSRPRLMMPSFLLLLGPAVALAGVRRKWVAVVVVGAAGVASGVYGAVALLGAGPP
ncbi:membrane protein [Streptomyces spiroverticillatus]|uniref:Membrane protein n=1 Tax=Streptomyces finlayi TaxID=67296 RepID=A0A918X4J1_9ACTN|nr:hypothetical protein [Streptomyces finlayi]GHA33454.1 membrane protein [Streptomyces spiroverticillatus]GHD11273.1 membrane protein [Streptomyces finlayi]